MKLIFGDPESILAKQSPRERLKQRRIIRLYDIERDKEGWPIAMYWRGDVDVSALKEGEDLGARNA